MQGIASLTGKIKHYDWGGYSFIPALLNMENTEHRPFAEYWMGIHPLGVSTVQWPDGRTGLLTEYAPDLPYLLKVLDVKDMLSIQVHPSKLVAQAEFERENREGIALDSPKRNYKDPNHKPEMLVALSDFYLLHGFKPKEPLLATLQRVPELRGLLKIFGQDNYSALYRAVMTMPQQEVNDTLRSLLDRIVPQYRAGMLEKSNEDFWAARAAITFTRDDNIDRGIFSIYLFNIVYLEKGEALFQGAGLPHAYLEGQNVELMSNSDNVLRGGLTTKHIDVNELLKHVKCEPTVPAILKPAEPGNPVRLFRPPVDDFQLSVTELKNGESVDALAFSTELILVTEGEVEIGGTGILLKAGQPAALALAGTRYLLKNLSEKSTCFRASAPVHNGE